MNKKVLDFIVIVVIFFIFLTLNLFVQCSQLFFPLPGLLMIFIGFSLSIKKQQRIGKGIMISGLVIIFISFVSLYWCGW
jgi:hypothetical protein